MGIPHRAGPGLTLESLALLRSTLTQPRPGSAHIDLPGTRARTEAGMEFGVQQPWSDV